MTRSYAGSVPTLRKAAQSRLFLVLFAGICLGCGKAPSFQVAPVSGRITLDGEPLEGGTVTFVPDKRRKTSGPIGVGQIQPDGTYQIVTDPGGLALRGAVVGFHKIRVVYAPWETVDGKWTKPDADTDFPRQFLSEETSGLDAEVLADIANAIDLDLERSASSP